MKIINFALVFLFSLSTFAAPKAYIDVSDSFFGSQPALVVNGQAVTRNFFTGYSGLAEAMSSDSKAKDLAEQAEKYHTWGSVFLWGGLAAALSYSFSTDAVDFDSAKYTSYFLIGFIPGAVLLGASQRKTIRAINQFNGVYSQKSSINLSPLKDGALVSLQYSF